jgi:hypothetical protein
MARSLTTCNCRVSGNNSDTVHVRWEESHVHHASRRG